MKNIGELLRKKRKEAGLTAEELADIAGVDRTYITKIEKHNNLPALPIMQIVCNKLDADELLADYLKIKYPAQYERLEKDKATSEVRYLNYEFMQIKEQVEKINRKGITPAELKRLKKRILFFGNDVNRSVRRLQDLIGELQKIKKIAFKPKK